MLNKLIIIWRQSLTMISGGEAPNVDRRERRRSPSELYPHVIVYLGLIS